MKTRRAKEKPPKKQTAKSGFTFRDLIHESLEGVGSKPSRLFITLFGTVLGIASLVATLGLAQTTAGQIAKNFDMIQATRGYEANVSAIQASKDMALGALEIGR